MSVEVRVGDCRDVMAGMDAESVDAIVTDPPYGLEFMGKDWDKLGVGASWERGGGFSKPGIGERPTAWVSFSATAKYGAANPTCATCGGRARGAKKCACEQPEWKPIGKRRKHHDAPEGLTGSGATNHARAMQDWHEAWAREAYRVLKPGGHLLAFGGTRTFHRLTVAVEDAGFEIKDCLSWLHGQGFPKHKTLLKPGWEPVVMAAKHGTRVVNIDACRLAERWPANVALDEAAAAMLGDPSRFFYVAKASRSERNAGLDGMPEVDWRGNYGDGIQDNRPHTRDGYRYESSVANHHPTVKPVALMRWLVRLVTPPDGLVLDPFTGSGTTGIACVHEGLRFVGIEQDAEYAEIARRRIAHAQGPLLAGVGQEGDRHATAHAG